MSSQGFDPKDLEEICARKPAKFHMKKADFKELGRNLLLGSVDVAVGSVAAVGIVASLTNSNPNSKASETSNYLQYTWEDRPYESENRDI